MFQEVDDRLKFTIAEVPLEVKLLVIGAIFRWADHRLAMWWWWGDGLRHRKQVPDPPATTTTTATPSTTVAAVSSPSEEYDA
jgi:hypothetical protein